MIGRLLFKTKNRIANSAIHSIYLACCRKNSMTVIKSHLIYPYHYYHIAIQLIVKIGNHQR